MDGDDPGKVSRSQDAVDLEKARRYAFRIGDDCRCLGSGRAVSAWLRRVIAWAAKAIQALLP
jgi:hypothetical protein